MDKQSLAGFIQRHVPLTGAALAEVLAQYEPRRIRKNELFLPQGVVSHETLFLEEGFLRAFTLDPDGNEVTTFFYSREEVVFEVSSFFLGVPSAESIQALCDCQGYTLSIDRLNRLFHTVPEFREFGRKMLVLGFAAFKQRTLSFVSETAEARYRHLLATKPELFRHTPLKHIASYLGVTDTSLSRIRRGLE